jgi:ferritin-like metal-binding protein YciE
MPLKEVLVGELRDLYSAENQLVKALPKLVKGAESEELSQLIADHLEETKGQVARLKDIFGMLGLKPTGKHCSGMEGVIEEGKEALEEDEEGAAFDLGICGGSVRVEHYEIAGYTACIAMAEGLGLHDVAQLLNDTLEEEKAASEKLTALAEELIEQAVSEGETEDPEEQGDKKPKTGKEKYSDKKSKEDEKGARPGLKGTKKK